MNSLFIGSITRWCLDTPLFKLDADNASIFAELVNETNQKRVSENPADSFFEDFVIEPSLCPETSKLLQSIRTTIHNYTGIESFPLFEYWSHIQYPKESTDLHAHNNVDMSFVYYVNVPKNSGDFCFVLNPLGCEIAIPPITPIEGTLMLFPGGITHKVTKNLSNEIRVSVAGNLRL